MNDEFYRHPVNAKTVEEIQTHAFSSAPRWPKPPLIYPTFDNVLLERHPNRDLWKDIIFPTTGWGVGTVVARGPHTSSTIQTGSIVIYNTDAGVPVEIGQEEFVLLPSSSILASIR